MHTSQQYLIFLTKRVQYSIRTILRYASGIVLAIALTGCASSSGVVANDDEKTLVTIIESIEHGWERADGKPFRDHFLDFEGARYIESGGQNSGLSDLVDNHVLPEGGAFDEFDLIFSNIETHVEGEFAWALADVELIAVLAKDGRRLHKRGYETFLFRSVQGQWKVIHTHSSTRPVKKEKHQH